MQWWVLELITIGVMVMALAMLGPLIKRFGRSYAADVFRANPRTGKSYIVLMDFAYYLIFPRTSSSESPSPAGVDGSRPSTPTSFRPRRYG